MTNQTYLELVVRSLMEMLLGDLSAELMLTYVFFVKTSLSKDVGFTNLCKKNELQTEEQ